MPTFKEGAQHISMIWSEGGVLDELLDSGQRSSLHLAGLSESSRKLSMY